MSQLYDHLRGQQADMTRTLEQLVMLESPSHERFAVNAVGDFLANAFTALDAQVERLPQTAFGDHLCVTWGSGDRQVLLLGHMDTVWPLGEIQRRPFRVIRSRAIGPGVFDMKGGLVVALYAVAALRELGVTPAHRLVFLFNADEEVGSRTSRP
ncbi:MAG: M20/M25/M40 family metallo-hydrolase, partial [Anaerolineae bacterium]